MNFVECCEYEKRMQPKADMFYKDFGKQPDRSISNTRFDVRLPEKTEEKFLSEHPWSYVSLEIVQDLQVGVNPRTNEVSWFWTPAVYRDKLAWFHPKENPDEFIYLYWCDWPKLQSYAMEELEDHPVLEYVYGEDWRGLRSYVHSELKTTEELENFRIVNKGYGETLNYLIKWKPLKKEGIVLECKKIAENGGAPMWVINDPQNRSQHLRPLQKGDL